MASNETDRIARLRELADKIVQSVAELPDRTSPDDWPEAMLVTADELRTILFDSELADALTRLQQDLPPPLADEVELFRVNPKLWQEEWARKHDFKAKLLQRAETAEATVSRLTAALRNVALSGRAALSFGHQATPQTPEKMLEVKERRLRDILRFCEEGGIESSVLRDAALAPADPEKAT